ncbi:hypothetical protein X975_07840, partial [Stegodyphus mimosarum]
MCAHWFYRVTIGGGGLKLEHRTFYSDMQVKTAARQWFKRQSSKFYTDDIR